MMSFLNQEGVAEATPSFENLNEISFRLLFSRPFSNDRFSRS